MILKSFNKIDQPRQFGYKFKLIIYKNGIKYPLNF